MMARTTSSFDRAAAQGATLAIGALFNELLRALVNEGALTQNQAENVVSRVMKKFVRENLSPQEAGAVAFLTGVNAKSSDQEQ